jgi:hypothetical protein
VGLTGFGTQSNFPAIDLLHRQVQALTAELCKLQAQGSKQEALTNLSSG